MKRIILALLAMLLVISSATMAAAADVTTTIHQFIDSFNAGDVKAVNASYATGDIVIVDEFAPHMWNGPHAPQDWSADYDKHAQATGVSDGSVKYGASTRTEIEDNVAYVVIPTVYNYKEHGKAITEEGQMTFVLHMEKDAWKIAAWTWTGVKPHPAK
ncbi:MAG TPA: nuclear transport factor 2 family protein [Terriglobales bacterium]|nr:nuclear transport factor 2 family protein [Terriglobales bacterium]